MLCNISVQKLCLQTSPNVSFLYSTYNPELDATIPREFGFFIVYIDDVIIL